MASTEEVVEIKRSMKEEVEVKEVAEIVQFMEEKGNYVATAPLLTTICNPCGSSSSPKDCLDKEYISHGHVIDTEEDINLRSNSITSCANMMDIQKVEQRLIILARQLRNARSMIEDGRNPITTCSHKVKDAFAEGNYLLYVANLIENGTPNTPYYPGLPPIAIVYDIMNPMLYPESLEVVAKALQQGFLGKRNMSQLVHFLHLLAGDLLDIAT